MTKTTKTNEVTITVHMVANDHGKSIRLVQLPASYTSTDLEYLLDAVFMYGQNDHQPILQTCSVSMGDVIEVDGKFYIVQSVGFQEMTAVELEEYKAIDEYDRSFSKFVRPNSAANMANEYDRRVTALEVEGLTRSDAQGVVDAEDLKDKGEPC